jgi:hypothetical protein
MANPLAAAASLVKFAVDAGGMDNITVALIPFRRAALPAGPIYPRRPGFWRP